MPEDVERLEAEERLTFYPHYWSTYCIHNLHSTCRLSCKTCGSLCLCPCHEALDFDGSQADG